MIVRKGEIEMKRVKNIIAISAFSMLVLALPSIASAQWGGNNGGYYPNGGNNRGQYGGQYGGNLEQVADRLKDRSKDFERQVDREFNNNRNRNYGGGGILGTIFNGGRNGSYGNRGYGNDQIKRLAEDFRKAANDFENRVDGNGRNNYRGQEAANRMLSIGSQLENQLRNMGGMQSNLQYQWNAIRNDLSIVANAYGNNQNRQRGGRNSRFPF
jgi:hypothetical protein